MMFGRIVGTAGEEQTADWATVAWLWASLRCTASSRIVTVAKSKMMRKAGHVARIRFVQNAHLFQVRITDGARSFGIHMAQEGILKSNFNL